MEVSNKGLDENLVISSPQDPLLCLDFPAYNHSLFGIFWFRADGIKRLQRNSVANY